MSVITSLAAFGESTFRGWNNGDDENPYMVPKMVGTAFGMDTHFRTVENMAVSGTDIYAQMQTSVTNINGKVFPGPLIAANIAGTKGLIAIINFGINDAYSGVAPATFKNSLLIIIDRLHRAGKIVFLQTPNKVSNTFLYKYDSASLKDGITVAQRNDQNAQKMREVASELGLPLSDVNALTIPRSDDVHPTNAGYISMKDSMVSQMPVSTIETMNCRVQAALLYIGLFCRAPESGGLAYWTGELAAGRLSFDSGSCANVMLAVPAVQLLYPSSMSNQAFIAALYVNVFGRQPDTDGLNYWLGVLNEYGNRGKVLSTMLDIGFNYKEYSNTNPLGLTSQILMHNRLAVGMAYGYIFNKSAVDTPYPYGILAGVTTSPATVVAATANL